MRTANVPPGDSAESSAISEEHVIQRILSGETDLYGILAARYGRRVYHRIRQIVKNSTEAEDILQEAHLRVLTQLHQFRGECKFVTWFSHVATNLAIRNLQRQQRIHRFFHSSVWRPEQARVLSSPAPDPESCVRDREMREVLRRAFTKLPAQYQTVFLLKEIKKLKTPEVATRLQIRCDNVRLQLHRARRILRNTIGENDSSIVFRQQERV